METLIDALRSQSNVTPSPEPPSWPYDVPVRKDGLHLLIGLYDKCKTGSVADITVQLEQLDAQV